MRIYTAIIAAFSATAVTSAAIAGRDVTTLPGYVDFDKEAMLGDVDATVEINLPTPMLDLIAGAANLADYEHAELLSAIDDVRIRVFPLEPANAGRVQSSIKRLVEWLEEHDWSRIVHVEEELQTVNIYTRLDGDNMAGLALVVADEQEFVFINIVGDIDAARMGSLIGMLPGAGDVNLGALDHIDETVMETQGSSSN